MFDLFSVDDHIIEHATVWSDRVPRRFLEMAPQVVVDGDREFWVYENRRGETMGLNAVAGKPNQAWHHDPVRFSDMIPGCYDPKARAEDMLADGIRASVCFPTLPRFGGALFPSFSDKALADACVVAYNDFVLDEWCPGGPPGMFVPMVIGQLWNPAFCAKEIARCVQKGARALSFPENPVPLGLPSFWTDHWDPVWRVCEEAGIPVCMHIGSSGGQNNPSPDAPHLLVTALGHLTAEAALVNLALSPVCRRFPGLKLVFSEGGIGWLPACLERADRQFLRHREWQQFDEVLPSEIFARNMWLCMIAEPKALTYRDLIGVEKIMWESDYPHADTPWPHSQLEVAEVFAGIPDDVIAAITHSNAENLFDWRMAAPASASAAPSSSVSS